MRQFALIILFFLIPILGLRAQELNATIEINTQKIEGTNKSVFENLKTTLTEFVNDRRWTSYSFKPVEKIRCSFTIIVNKYSEANGMFDCECYIQSTRPVYNASYSTNVWQQHDSKFNFSFMEFDKLNYDDEHIDKNITALFAYYCYLIIGLDLDTMSPMGGTEYLQKAMDVAEKAQNLESSGWRAFDDVNNRFAIINDLTSEAMAPFRQMLYDYHRKGLDQMHIDSDVARKNIMTSFNLLKQANQNKPLSTLPRLFAEIKKDEFVNIFKGKETPNDKQPIYDLLSKLNAALSSQWKEILK